MILKLNSTIDDDQVCARCLCDAIIRSESNTVIEIRLRWLRFMRIKGSFPIMSGILIEFGLSSIRK